MTEKWVNMIGWMGDDYTTDPYILGKNQEAPKSQISYNFRAKNGIRVARKGYEPVLDLTTDETGETATGRFRKSGAHFPYGAKAILPLTTTDYIDSFYLASDVSTWQKEFTIEVWVRTPYLVGERFIMNIPVEYDTSAITRHMSLSLAAFSPWTKGGSLRPILRLCVEEEAAPGTLHQVEIKGEGDTFIKADGEWHHIALTRADGSDEIKMYFDADYKGLLDATPGTYDGEPFPKDSSFKEDATNPLYHNHLEIGDWDLDIAELRIWKTERTYSEIEDNYNIELVATDEDDLVTYVPFNEGTGKHFSDSKGRARGYFTPQEPYVNGSNELVFTGHNCMAYPSLRAKWQASTGAGDGSKMPVGTTYHKDNCEDAAYDGGILWDTKLKLDSAFDYDLAGIWSGTAQIRLRLRQLKEGVICGRLGMCFDTTDDAYRLFLVDEENSKVYMSDAVVDETWVGAEKTITVIYMGQDTLDDDEICKFYEDDTEITDSTPTSNEWIWANGDEILTNSLPHVDLDWATDEEKDMPGAIGGSTSETNMCIAFDLIFFRQWWDDYPIGDQSDETDFIADTFETAALPDTCRYFLKGISGYFNDGQNYITCDTNDHIDAITNVVSLKYMRIPIHYASDDYEMPTTGESYLFITISTKERLFKQDVLIRRIHSWLNDPPASGDFQILKSSINYETSDVFSGKRYFDNALISNLVNEYNADTFKKNQVERPVFDETEGDMLDTVAMRIYNTITDDSPLQGIEKAGSAQYKSRYLQLGTEARTNCIHKMRSLKPRWCDGPISPTTIPGVRAIFRYKSEDEKVDKLIAIAWNSMWEIDADAGTMTPIEKGWIDRNSDLPVNMLIANNRLIVMDTQAAVKMNYKGDMSRLGVERPTDVQIVETDTGANFAADEEYGYVAQFYDSVNGAYSGTLPVYSDEGQSAKVVVNTDIIDVKVRACKDANVDRMLVYRTDDMGTNGSGTETDLYLIKHGGVTKQLDDYNYFGDPWDDVTGQNYLSSQYYGQDLVPPNCKAMCVALNRLFLLNTADAKSTLYWSLVDSLGFPAPDMVQQTDSMIIEEGGTTVGTAIVEFAGHILLFKDNSVFRVYEDKPGSFANSFIYKGAGALNQRCVVVAKGVCFFLDKNGLYVYQSGEPVLASDAMTDYFRDELDFSDTTTPFILHDKKNDTLMIFAPSTDSLYCDRCILHDLKTKTYTVDMIPDVTCGYIDDEDIYLGTPYGQILKYSDSVYADGVDTVQNGIGDVTGLVLTDSGLFAADYSLVSVPVFLEDTTNSRIWRGIITEHTVNSVEVDAWEPLFNTTDTSPSSATMPYKIGHLYLYDKTPLYSFYNDHLNKTLVEVEVLANRMSAAELMHLLVKINQGAAEFVETGNISEDRLSIRILKALHKSFTVEYAAVVDRQLDVKGYTYLGEWTRGRLGQ